MGKFHTEVQFFGQFISIKKNTCSSKTIFSPSKCFFLFHKSKKINGNHSHLDLILAIFLKKFLLIMILSIFIHIHRDFSSFFPSTFAHISHITIISRWLLRSLTTSIGSLQSFSILKTRILYYGKILNLVDSFSLNLSKFHNLMMLLVRNCSKFYLVSNIRELPLH